jgi:HSP20 family protein
MANIVRKGEGGMLPTGTRGWDPFEMMRELFGGDPLRQLLSGHLQHQALTTFVPHFEVRETNDAYIFKADMPGVKDQDLDINIAQNRLTVTGKREMEQRDENDRYYAFERAYGSFTRTFTLPADIDDQHVEADLKDGVLSLRVPKRPEQQAKKVQIKTGGGSAGGGGKTAKATPES